MKNYLLLTIFLSLFVLKTQAQTQDSVSYYIEQSKISSANYNFDKAIFFVKKSITYQKKKKSNNLSKEHIQFGNIFKTFGEYDSALVYFNLALKTNITDNDLAFIHLQKGRVHRAKKEYSASLNNLKSALVLYEKINDSLNIGVVNLNLGNVFKSLKKNTTAIKYYHEALFIFNKTKSEQLQAGCYNNLGNLYKNIKQYDSAAFYMYKTLAIRKKSDNITHISYIYHNLSNLHFDLNNVDSALYYINKSLQLKFVMKNEKEIYLDYISLGDIYNFKKDFKNSTYYYNEAYKAAKLQNDLEMQMETSKNLGDNYLKLNNYKLSAKNYKNYLMLSDSIDKSRNYEELEEELIAYEQVKDSLAKKQLMLINKNAVIKKHNLELNHKMNQTNKKYLKLVVGILILSSVLLFFSFKRRLKISEQYKQELEAQNEELKRTLISKEEKETLLKEIHHRVKNNLQIINSLIRLQSNYMTEKNYKHKLLNTENRIRSMALVHEKLYKSEHLSKLNAKLYISDLVANIIRSVESGVPINITYNIDDSQFSIDTLIPLGLIINEVVSNSVKYAFEGKQNGEITIDLKTDSVTNSTNFIISDNGMGADINYEELSDDSLGMELIQTLTEQLDGTINLNTNNGFKYTFNFKGLK